MIFPDCYINLPAPGAAREPGSRAVGRSRVPALSMSRRKKSKLRVESRPAELLLGLRVLVAAVGQHLGLDAGLFVGERRLVVGFLALELASVTDVEAMAHGAS